MVSMPKTVLNIKLSDLTRIRVTCSNCSCVCEASIADMAEQTRANDCPICEKPIMLGRPEDNPFYLLKLAVEGFSKKYEKCAEYELEFPVELPDSE